MAQSETLKKRKADSLPKPTVSQVVITQKHGVPALLSFFIPGLGQIVKGEVGKGILAFIGVGIGSLMLVIPGVIIWIWQIADAYNSNR